jgi:hypothetical protein
MLKDRSYANIYLRNAAILIEIGKYTILPPSSYDVFSAIVKSHEVNQQDIENSWRYTGGILAAALMI